MIDNPLIETGLPVALMVIMAGMGLTLTLADFRYVFASPRAMVVGTVAQIVLIPLLAFGLIELFGPSSAIAVGLVIIAACPGGATSNVFTFLARGNLALSIVLTVIASLITIVSIPFFANLALDLYAAGDAGAAVRLPLLDTVVRLAVIIVIPVALGMFVRARFEEVAAWGERFVNVFGLAVLGAIIVVLVFQTRTQILALLSQAGPSVIALNLGGIALGFLSGRLGGISRQDGLTIAIEVGIKNGTIGLMVTLSLLHSAEMAIPSAVYGVLMFAAGGLLAAYGRRSETAEAQRRRDFQE
jgi:BASS family bile acid:Na+ symporter